MASVYRKSHKMHGDLVGALPKGLFLIVALAGAALVWILKSYHADPFFTVLVPVSMILLYCGLTWQTKFFYIREDQIGDNAYYLGFLFTLSSLAYALWRFQVDNSSDPADIIGSFGVALWSTIVGVALRVFFAQIRQDPHDIEKEARVKIAQTASLLSSDLHQASVTFNNYTRSLQQSVEEVFLQAKSISQDTSKAFSDLNKKILKIESPDNLINQKVESLFGDLSGATKKLNALAASQGNSIEVIAEASNQLARNIQALNEQVISLKEGSSFIDAGSHAMKDVVILIQDLQTAMHKLIDSFAVFDSQQALAVNAVTTHADALEQQLLRSRQYTEDTHAALTSMTKTLAAKLK